MSLFNTGYTKDYYVAPLLQYLFPCMAWKERWTGCCFSPPHPTHTHIFTHIILPSYQIWQNKTTSVPSAGCNSTPESFTCGSHLDIQSLLLTKCETQQEDPSTANFMKCVPFSCAIQNIEKYVVTLFSIPTSFTLIIKKAEIRINE